MTSNVQLIGKHVAILSVAAKRFLQMHPNGEVGVVDDPNFDPNNPLNLRTWERFLVVDAGFGKIALHSSAHNRFLRMHRANVDGFGGWKDADKLPPNSE